MENILKEIAEAKIEFEKKQLIRNLKIVFNSDKVKILEHTKNKKAYLFGMSIDQADLSGLEDILNGKPLFMIAEGVKEIDYEKKYYDLLERIKSLIEE